jgi:carbamate kinase
LLGTTLPRDGQLQERTIVIALGGNALSQPGEGEAVAEQFRRTRTSLEGVARLAADGWRMAIVHGNGPQVGNFLVQQELARGEVPPLPLGVLVAATEGWIGYMIQQSLQNVLAREGVDRQVVTMVTQVLVDGDDPSLQTPNKPIGRALDRETAMRRREQDGWAVMETPGGWRRVVGSPRPLEIVECEMVRALVAQGHLVIAAGGGGTPVRRDSVLGFEGVDAVVDKDRAAAVLARDIGAEALLILTDVDAAYVDFGTERQRALGRVSVEEARGHLSAGAFGTGSMAPKMEAAINFVADGGKRAIIARLDQGLEAVEGRAGTEVAGA